MSVSFSLLSLTPCRFMLCFVDSARGGSSLRKFRSEGLHSTPCTFLQCFNRTCVAGALCIQFSKLTRISCYYPLLGSSPALTILNRRPGFYHLSALCLIFDLASLVVTPGHSSNAPRLESGLKFKDMRESAVQRDSSIWIHPCLKSCSHPSAALISSHEPPSTSTHD